MGKTIGKILGTVLTIIGSIVLLFNPAAGSFLLWAGRAMVVAGMALSMLSQQKPNLAQKMSGNGHLINTRSTNECIPIVYGEMRIGGNQVFITTTGSDNKYLHIVMSLSEGEIEDVETVYFDDKLSSDPFFSGYASFEHNLGTLNQTVIANLQTAYPAFTDTMRGTALLYIKLTYDTNKFPSGIPLITAKIKGRKLYDPRNSTTAYSNNCALVVYDILTNTRYGMGRSASLINMQSIIDAANICDSLGFTFNGSINSQDAAQDVMDMVLANMRGYLVWTGSDYKLGVFAFDSPVMTLTEDDIVEDSFEIELPGLPETPNKINVKFIDPEKKYTVSDFGFEEQDVLTIEGSERTADLTLLGTTSYQKAVDMATYFYERLRLNKAFSFVASRKAIPLEPGDIILITHTLPGWTLQECRVLTANINPDQTVSLSVNMETALLYDSKLNITSHVLYEGTIPDITLPPDPVGNVVITEQLVTSKERTYSRFKISFTKPDSVWWSHVDVYVSTDGTNYDFFTSAKDNFFIEPVSENTTYYFKFKGVSIYNVSEDYDTLDVWSKTVVGKSALPSDITNFSAIPVGDYVNFKWDEATDIDIAGYEIREGSSWDSAVKLARVQSVLSYMAVGIKPGEHTFWIKAKDTLGQYSENAASQTITILYPSGYVDKYSWTTDFNEGVHTNTAYMDDGTYGRVLYVNSGLTGTWESAVKDMGSAKDMRFWINYLIALIGDETLWEGQYGATDTWEKFDAALTWNAIFQPTEAASLTIELMHSLDNVNWTTIPNFHIFSGEVNCRYVKYKITITNLSANAYLYVKPSTLIGAYWN